MKHMISLLALEQELKKRLSYRYIWSSKQNNTDDTKTNFIYNSPYFLYCFGTSEKLFGQYSRENHLFNYALNRWYNFWSAQGVEHMFAQLPSIIKTKNKKDQEKDFYIHSIPFDHKTSVFPKGFRYSMSYAQKNPEKLIQWFYENQSQQNRHHLKNRVFLVLYDSKTQEHWKLKACLLWIWKLLYSYKDTLLTDQFYTLSINNKEIKSILLWGIK